MREAHSIGRFSRSGAIRGLAAILFVVVGSLASGAEDVSRTGLTEAPLAERSGPRGATLFAALPPQQTGIVTENNYDDPRMWAELYQELVFGAIGTGVAAGDFDNDGRPDLFVVGKTGRSRLFRNLGRWRFEDVSEKAGLAPPAAGDGWTDRLKRWFGSDAGEGDDAARAWHQGATFADVDNDGWLDLYVCRLGAPNLLFMNQRDGTFRDEAAMRGLAIRDASGMAAFCDYDRDGWLDVYIQTNLLDAAASPDGQRDHLLRNDGDGTFSDVTDRAGIPHIKTAGHSATWWDFDSDGWPDLSVANDFSVPDFWYRNNGDGTFSDLGDAVVPHMPFYAMGADIGDVNNDGRLDLHVADMHPTTHEKDQRGMAYSRALNKEADPVKSATPQHMRNALYLDTGTGRMLEAACLAGVAATDWTWSVRFEDLDNDGRVDLHVTNGMIREYHNTDILDRIMGSESVPAQRALMRDSPVLAEANLAFRNLGDLRFEEVGAAWGLGQVGVSFGAAFADIDGDGDLDLVFSNYESGATVLRNDSDSGHRVIFELRGTRSNRYGVGATVRVESASGAQVRQLVLARGYLSSSEPVLHFGLGEDTRLDRVIVSWPSGYTQTFTDLPVDRRFTITEPENDSRIARHSKVESSDGSGDLDIGMSSYEGAPAPALFKAVSASVNLAHPTRETPANAADTSREQPLLPFRLDRRGPALAVGDLDGDGRDDLVIAATSQEPARILLRDASSPRRFREAAGAELLRPTPPLEAGPILVFDADGDGADDLLLTHAGTALPAGAAGYQPRLLLNNAPASRDGSFRPAPDGALPALPISAGAVAAADFDRDGRLDVFLGGRVLPGRYPLSPPSVLLRSRGGASAGFDDVTDAVAPGLRGIGMVTAALWSDCDGDGWPDLLVTLEWGGVRYLRNNAGRGLEDRSEAGGFAAAGTGWWSALAAADFNGDGRPDYVAGNVGLNTPYRATPERPALLFFGEFSARRGQQLIEAYYEGDRLLPWRTRKELGAHIPAVLRRFPSNDRYAASTLGEILGEDKLAAAQRFAATELRSGVFLSQPDGTHRFEPLPRMAQIAPLRGIAAGDFDGDGHADIVAVQNSYSPNAYVGRFDGGLGQFLRGDGRGGFTAVGPAESGLIVPGEATALAVLDVDDDGHPDLAVSRANSTMLAFRNNGAATVRVRTSRERPRSID